MDRSDSSSAKDSPLRVQLLLRDLTRGGATRLALNLFASLRDEVSLRSIAWEGGPLAPEFRRLGPLDVLWSDPGSLRFLRTDAERRIAGMAVGRLRMPVAGWTARRSRPHLVYANSIRSLHLVSRLGLAEHRVVLHVHELSVALEGFESANPGLIRSLPSHFIAVSQIVASVLVDEYQIPSDAITVIPPFVAIPPGLVAKEAGEGVLTVGGIGTLTWTKGGVLWLLAARDLIALLGENRVRFRWVGYRDNDEGRQFKAMVRKLGLASVVELVPETSDARAELSTFDVLAMTSWEESASLVVLEAMAEGVPVVCFAGAGGPEEQIGDTGVVVEGFSTQALAEAIAALREDPVRWQSLRVAARRRVTAKYSQEVVVPTLTGVLRKEQARAT